MSFGFRFLLVYPDGEPADPGVFNTAIPNWRPDEFLAGSDLRTFRIVAVSDQEPPPETSGVLVVRAVEE